MRLGLRFWMYSQEFILTILQKKSVNMFVFFQQQTYVVYAHIY